MARKAAATAKAGSGSSKQAARRRSPPKMDANDAPADRSRADTASGASATPDYAAMAKVAKMMTPEQAITLYKANAALALEVINTAIEGTAQLRRKQLEGAAQASEFQQRHAQSAAQARDPQALVAAGQGAAQEAMERSLRYWSEMFDLIVEIQKRLFTLMEDQMEGVPGVKETRAAMAMLPDMGQMQKVVSAMQGVVSSGESTFASMQRVMGDFAKLAQGAVPGGRR
ncbi:MAG TPA: phasin family protein [Casimicrobiaceae bacterium]|nr:phasin family protein [Casimicrobiaceae bacterium]